MFNQFLKNVDDVIETAKSSNNINQTDYFPIYDIIENYVKSNSLILSNIDTLISKPRSTKRSYIIYGTNIFKHANNLSNDIAKKTIYVLLFTNKKNEDFTILVNGSPLIQLYNIYSKMELAIQPIKMNNMMMYPPEFELINVYHKLYLPNFASEWDIYKEYKVVLEQQLIKRKNIIGGKKQIKPKKPFDSRVILNWIKERSGYVLIGENAINTLTNKPKNLNKIQIITDHVQQFTSELENFIKQYTGFEPTFKVHSANIPIESRIQKTVVTINIKINGKRRNLHILDIFNNAEYELIPYTTYDGFNIAYPNVLKMFQLLDLWYLRILKALGMIENISHITSNIFSNLELINNLSDSLYTKEAYIGINYEYQRYKKKQGTNNKFFPYNPSQHKYIKGSYRHI